MTTKELMLNDIVTFKDCLEDNFRHFPVKIVAIGYQDNNENEVLASIDGDGACDIIEVNDEVVGMPLTRELVEKNGFKCTPAFGERLYYGKGFEIWIDFKNAKHWINIKVNAEDKRELPLHYYEGYIDSVHQLQHILRFCGLSDLADNFKVD